ncbi:hypothetical protein ACWCXH_14360 [Kitasatospora sp. NPDC001660]
MGILDALSNAAARAADSYRSGVALRELRGEHDDWARGAELGTVYFTAFPTTNIGGGRPSHSTFVFVKKAFDGQLITDCGTPSWALWRECGPFTPARKWTHADERERLAELDAKLGAGMAQVVLDRFTAQQIEADVARRYPVSAQLAAA